MNRIIYTFFKTLAVLFVLFIFLSISALAQSFTLHNIALLVVSVICLNKTIQWAFLLGRPIFTCMFVRTE